VSPRTCIQNGVLVIISKIRNKIINVFSFRVQIFITLFLLGTASLCILTAGIINEYKYRGKEYKMATMEEYGKKISNQILLTGYFSSVNQDAVNAELGMIADIGYGRLVLLDENLKVIYDTYDRDVGKVVISDAIIRTLKGNGGNHKNENGRYVEFIMPIYNFGTKTSHGIIIMDFAFENEYKMAGALENSSFIMLVAFFVALFAISFVISERMTAPLREIVKYMMHVSDGHVDDEMKIGGNKEIRQISKAHNEMMNQMKRLENSRQEFVSNVSHELKTPMTSIKVLADSLIGQGEVPVELYREFLTDINDEIERENKVINDLLTLVKLDKNTSDMNISPVSINDLLDVILKRLKPIAQSRNVELIYESFRPVNASVDEVKMSLAISNLIENAIKYNVDDGTVRVSLNADHKYFYIKVIDTGIGISEEQQKMIFERFYRVDKARSRQTGGTGLGLAITKDVVLMHNGTIKVSSKENEGSTFTMRIPLNITA